MTGDTVADRRVHPGTIALKFLKDAPRTVIGIPAILALTSEIGWATLLLLALAAIVVIALVEWLSWSRFKYGIGSQEIVIESGILSRNRRSIPFERVQDVDIERGPLQRLAGLARVKIETGGAAKDEGVLDSITMAEADRIRAAIRAGRVESAGAEPIAEQRAEPDSRTVYALGPRRLLLLGLFNFSLIYLAVLFGILNTIEPWIPFDIYDPGRWLGLVGEERVRNLSWGGAAAVLLVALVLGVISGLVSTVAREFGFRLVAEGKRLRRERGLLTRSEVVVPKMRVQLALLRSGPLRRVLGFAELSFQTLGAGAESGGRQSVAPLARPEEIAAVVAEVERLRLPEPGLLRRVSRGHILRTAIRTGSLPLAAILVASWWAPEALLATLLLPLLVGGAVLSRRFSGYALRDGLLFAASGWWRRRLWVVPVGNVQSLRVTRSPLQRRLGLASIAVDTAGAPTIGAPAIVDLDVGTAWALVEEMTAALRG